MAIIVILLAAFGTLQAIILDDYYTLHHKSTLGVTYASFAVLEVSSLIRCVNKCSQHARCRAGIKKPKGYEGGNCLGDKELKLWFTDFSHEKGE